MAEWAIASGRWTPRPGDFTNQLAEQFARAMRAESFVDSRGRTVRAKHAARIMADDGQLAFEWADIRTAPTKHLEVALQQRRQAIVSDCYHLKADVDYFNEEREPERPIQLVLDFTFDWLKWKPWTRSRRRPRLPPRRRRLLGDGAPFRGRELGRARLAALQTTQPAKGNGGGVPGIIAGRLGLGAARRVGIWSGLGLTLGRSFGHDQRG